MQEKVEVCRRWEQETKASGEGQTTKATRTALSPNQAIAGGSQGGWAGTFRALASSSRPTRLLLKDHGGWGGGGGLFVALASPGPPAHPPKSEKFPPAEIEICQKGRKFEADFRYTHFCWPLTPPPPPRRRGVGVTDPPTAELTTAQIIPHHVPVCLIPEGGDRQGVIPAPPANVQTAGRVPKTSHGDAQGKSVGGESGIYSTFHPWRPLHRKPHLQPAGCSSLCMLQDLATLWTHGQDQEQRGRGGSIKDG